MKGLNVLQTRATAWRVAAAILVAMLMVSPVVAQVTAVELPNEALRLVQTWLLTDCEVGQEGQLEFDLKEWGSQLEPVFLVVLESGPDSTLLANFEATAIADFEQYEALLRTGEDLGLSQENLEAARRVTREHYLDQEEDSFIHGYKSQALLGLALIGNEAADQVLQQIADDEASPLKSNAERALELLRSQNQ